MLPRAGGPMESVAGSRPIRRCWPWPARWPPTPRSARCVADKCLVHAPKIVVGGNGVSAPVFLDNAAYRKYLSATFGARVADMESAAVAHVAYVNGAPFIAFRSLSDLAGGGAGANEMHTFMGLASENSASVVKAFVKALP
jgi:adenosylhomocysteine nucleosidase